MIPAQMATITAPATFALEVVSVFKGGARPKGDRDAVALPPAMVIAPGQSCVVFEPPPNVEIKIRRAAAWRPA